MGFSIVRRALSILPHIEAHKQCLFLTKNSLPIPLQNARHIVNCQAQTTLNIGFPKGVIQQKQSIGRAILTKKTPTTKHLKTARGELSSPPRHCFLTDILFLLRS